jgi:two-component system KDP operon response regulator KdpE
VTRTAPLLLVVDDDSAFAQGLASELVAQGYETVTAADGQQGLEVFLARHPDLVVTDDAMPRLDGFGLIEAIRRTDRTPIIVLSVRDSEGNQIRALNLGADDYVTKPFSFPVLLARVRAQLRRLGAAGPTVLEFHGLRIDCERHRVLEGERLTREVRLTPTEFAILEVLALSAGRPVGIAQIATRVWKGAPAPTADTVRVQVGALRRKLEPDPSRPRYLVTEPWIGYRFAAEPLK